MSISDKSLSKIANAMTEELCNEIQNDERINEAMYEVICELITQKLGTLEDELRVDLAFAVLERIVLVSRTH